jgi:hypothetical protein
MGRPVMGIFFFYKSCTASIWMSECSWFLSRIKLKRNKSKKQERKYLCGNMFFLYFVRNFVPQIKLIVLFLSSFVYHSSCLLVHKQHFVILFFCYPVFTVPSVQLHSEIFGNVCQFNCVGELISQTHYLQRSIPLITSDYVQMPAMFLLQFFVLLQYIAMIHCHFSLYSSIYWFCLSF